jgi:hypothetical protein
MGTGAILRFAIGLVKTWDKRRAACFSRLVAGAMLAGRLGVAAIGRWLPSDTTDKHRIKAVDRFLGNGKVDLDTLWVSLLAIATSGVRRLYVLLDWTDLDGRHEVLQAAVCYGGRAVPVAWATARKGHYLRSRNRMESTLCTTIKALLPVGVELVIVADRGFARASLFRALRRAGIHFIIRIRREVHLLDDSGRGPVAKRRVRRGQTRDFPAARYGEDARVRLRCVVTLGRSDGKKQPQSPWYLATSLMPWQLPAIDVVAGYKRRMRIEHNFRDHKSYRFGLQLRGVTLSSADRYDRLLAIAAVALLLLMCLGATVEDHGLHRQFKANTDPRRTHSLLQLGLAYLHRALIDKPAQWLLLTSFDGPLEGMG